LFITLQNNICIKNTHTHTQTNKKLQKRSSFIAAFKVFYTFHYADIDKRLIPNSVAC